MIRRIVTAYYMCWDAFDEACDRVVDFLTRQR